ncbi:MerR family transcriptional regulator [Nonomuraea sp. NPDC049504]|uniref:MerR family transcriptional regulator n=1 Tax=Nonomuraea sp. NPDC049504 TaxID=3154729 RepID=UPI0034276EDA
MKSSTTMTIGDVAERFGLATHVLRHWETMGLLTPARVNGQRRRYGRDDLYRVAVILRAKEAGFSLDEIREMMTTSNPATRRAVLVRRRKELAERIAAAQASLDLIDCALECDHEDIGNCPHFQAMVAQRISLDPHLTRGPEAPIRPALPQRSTHLRAAEESHS